VACIRWIVIQNFRGIKQLSWKPGPGINCLIGPGDSSKSTVLDGQFWLLQTADTMEPLKLAASVEADTHTMVSTSILELFPGSFLFTMPGVKAPGCEHASAKNSEAHGY